MKNNEQGFSVIEVLLAATIFLIFSTGIITVAINGLNMGRLAAEQNQAAEFASEGIEAVKSIKNKSYINLVNSGGTGVSTGPSGWTFSGTNNTFDKFTRVITVTDVNRDGTGNIVSSGGTLDDNTKKITSTVNWNFTPTRANSVVYYMYLTNFRKSIMGNWALPSIASTVNLPGNVAGYDVVSIGNYVYVVKNTSPNNLSVIDISNLAAPVLGITISLSGNITAISHDSSGSYTYVTASDNAREMQVINLSTPSTPAQIGVFNATGNADGISVFSVGSTVYFGRTNSGDPEFYIVNVSTPATPVTLGSFNLNGNTNDIYVLGNYVYIASSDNNSELQIIDISTPSSPTLTGVANLSGNSDGTKIAVFGNIAIVGRADGTVVFLNIATPASPSNISTYNAGAASVSGLDISADGTYLFLTLNATTSDFKVIDISTPTSPSLYGSLNIANVNNDMYYNPLLDRVFIANTGSATELVIIQPN